MLCPLVTGLQLFRFLLFEICVIIHAFCLQKFLSYCFTYSRVLTGRLSSSHNHDCGLKDDHRYLHMGLDFHFLSISSCLISSILVLDDLQALSIKKHQKLMERVSFKMMNCVYAF